jgi:hypothetical protein
MHKQITVALLLCATFSLAADQKPQVFYFGGKGLFVGMPQSEAVAVISACCKLSPPSTPEMERAAANKNVTLSRFIFSNDGSPRRILGTIIFSDGKVARITRPLDADKFNPVSDDIVAFARALDRSLSPEGGDPSAVVFVSRRHDRVSNGEAEFLTFSFPNGRAIELQISTLDIPSTVIGGRDAVGLDEILESPKQ